MAYPSPSSPGTGERPAAGESGMEQGDETRRDFHDPLAFHLSLAAGSDLRPRGMRNRSPGQRDRLFHAGGLWWLASTVLPRWNGDAGRVRRLPPADLLLACSIGERDGRDLGN